jgi:hypothetical protein
MSTHEAFSLIFFADNGGRNLLPMKRLLFILHRIHPYSQYIALFTPTAWCAYPSIISACENHVHYKLLITNSYYASNWISSASRGGILSESENNCGV